MVNRLLRLIDLFSSEEVPNFPPITFLHHSYCLTLVILEEQQPALGAGHPVTGTARPQADVFPPFVALDVEQ